MTWRRVGIYYVVLALLGAYYLAVERQSPAPPPPPDRTQLVDVPLDRITEMRLVRGTERVVSRMEGGRWRVVEPAGARAPSDLLGLLVQHVVEASAVEVVAQGGGAAEEFGLDGRAGRIELYPRGQRTPVTVALGARNPSGTALYVRVEGSPRILLVGSIIEYYAQRVFEEARASRESTVPREGEVPGRGPRPPAHVAGPSLLTPAPEGC
jgi:hypothetical protein